MSWWQRLLVWLGISRPGDRKEQMEVLIASHGREHANFGNRQAARRALRNHYFQRLKGWAKPTDDDEDPDNDFAGLLPAWSDLSVDVWEAPAIPRGTSTKGYVLNIFVTEIDSTEWVLRIDSVAGSLGWTKISPVLLPT